MEDQLYDEMKRAQASFHDRAMTIPGVHATSIGMKSVAGETTPTFAIIVHTTKKRPLEEVPEAERVPEQLGGFPTDVVESDPLVPAAVDRLEGGATLAVALHEGTLGCMVQDNNADKTPYLLSNAHVLNGTGSTVYVKKPDVCHRVGYTKSTVNDDKVDAAIASIGETMWLAAVANIGDVKGTRPAKLAANARKMGRSTGLTNGFIAELNYEGKDSTGRLRQEQVIVWPNEDTKNLKFADSGDSGSVIVDDDGFVVALLWATSVETRPDGKKFTRAAACTIQNVEAALKVTVSTAVGTDAPQLNAETFSSRLEALCQGSSRAQEYYQAYRQHRDEIQHLFHDNARLYVIWRKIPQEAFMDAFEAGVRDPSEIIPTTLDGQDTTAILTQLRDGLAQYVEDPNLMRQVDALCADLQNSVGTTWREAIDKSADPIAPASSERTPGEA